jgi:hypothetical protein
MFETDIMNEVKDPKGCKWFYNGGCNLHPLSDNTPSTCSNCELYPCKDCVKYKCDNCDNDMPKHIEIKNINFCCLECYNEFKEKELWYKG